MEILWCCGGRQSQFLARGMRSLDGMERGMEGASIVDGSVGGPLDRGSKGGE